MTPTPPDPTVARLVAHVRGILEGGTEKLSRQDRIATYLEVITNCHLALKADGYPERNDGEADG